MKPLLTDHNLIDHIAPGAERIVSSCADLSLEDHVRIALYENHLRLFPANMECRFELFSIYQRVQDESQMMRWMTSIVHERFPPLRDLSERVWLGGALEGQTIAVLDVAGFGDSLQNVRYLPLIQARKGRILLACRPELSRLFSPMPSVDAMCLLSGESIDHLRSHAFDVYVTLTELPLILSATGGMAPPPYLSPYKTDVEQWQEELGQETKVGLVWACGNGYMPQRSCHAIDLAPLSDLPNITLIGLQKGRRAEEAAQIPGLMPLGHRFQDFADVAAAVTTLDLVITVDTATAHLAGALGKPVWLLLPFVADPRWKDLPDACDLYPNMRLYRQQTTDDWASLVTRVCEDLGWELSQKASLQDSCHKASCQQTSGN